MLLNCLFIDIENPDVSIKDLFLCSEKDNLEMPHSTEHGRMRNSGLGYQYNVKFPLSASSADVRTIFFREFPRLREAPAFYVCAKGPGTTTKLSIKNYSVPSGQEIRVRILLHPQPIF